MLYADVNVKLFYSYQHLPLCVCIFDKFFVAHGLAAEQYLEMAF